MKNGKAVAASVFHLWIRITPLEFCLLALRFIFLLLLPTLVPSSLEYEFVFYHFRARYFTERFYGVFYDKHDGKSFLKKRKNE